MEALLHTTKAVNVLDRLTSPIDLRAILAMVASWPTWQLWLAHGWEHMSQFRERWTVGFFRSARRLPAA